MTSTTAIFPTDSAPNRTPDWVKHATFYQIFPDRMARGQGDRPDPYLHHVSFEDWDAPPTVQGYKGGNLWGIRDRLDYLQDLGITAIYFTPIFQSACNHRYHTHDYYQVDPILGGNEAFFRLLREAHRRNLRVVLDGVFNHASRGFFFFHDILENGPHSPWVEWFTIEGWPLSAYDGAQPANYAGWANNRALPEFNHHHPGAREYVMRVAEYWIRQGIDGWRLDVPNCIDVPGFWQEFRDRVKAINPEAYIVGEIWGDATPWLDGTQFDGVMNYPFADATIGFTAGDRVVRQYVEPHAYLPCLPLDAAGYAAKIRDLLARYPWDIQLAQLNLLDSHDTARLLTVAGGDRHTVALATLLLMTFPGAPSIYYGDEVGLAGGNDPDCRRSFPDSAQWDWDVRDYHKQLLALRRDRVEWRIGDYRMLHAEGNVYAFARVLGDRVSVVAVNAGTDVERVAFPVESLPVLPEVHLYGTGTFAWSQDGDRTTLHLELLPRQGLAIGVS